MPGDVHATRHCLGETATMPLRLGMRACTRTTRVPREPTKLSYKFIFSHAILTANEYASFALRLSDPYAVSKLFSEHV